MAYPLSILGQQAWWPNSHKQKKNLYAMEKKKIQDPSDLVTYILKEFRKFPFPLHLSTMFALQTVVFQFSMPEAKYKHFISLWISLGIILMLSTLPLSFNRYLQMREGTYIEMQERKHINIYYPSKAYKRPFSPSSTQEMPHLVSGSPVGVNNSAWFVWCRWYLRITCGKIGV